MICVKKKKREKNYFSLDPVSINHNLSVEPEDKNEEEMPLGCLHSTKAF